MTPETVSVFKHFSLPRPEVIIRELRESDALALEWHGGADLRQFYQTQWQKHLIGEATVLIADFNGFPIGQGALYWHGKPTHPEFPDLQSLRVHPVFRGQSIGTQLIDAAAHITAARGLHQLSLSVGADNERARALYERCGFVVTSPPYEDGWEYIDAQGQTIRVTETIIDMIKQL